MSAEQSRRSDPFMSHWLRDISKARDFDIETGARLNWTLEQQRTAAVLLADKTDEREHVEALWRKYLDMADANADEGAHVGFSAYYRNVAHGLGLALNVLNGIHVSINPYDNPGDPDA